LKVPGGELLVGQASSMIVEARGKRPRAEGPKRLVGRRIRTVSCLFEHASPSRAYGCEKPAVLALGAAALGAYLWADNDRTGSLAAATVMVLDDG
jgi:hypothetical protein